MIQLYNNPCSYVNMTQTAATASPETDISGVSPMLRRFLKMYDFTRYGIGATIRQETCIFRYFGDS